MDWRSTNHSSWQNFKQTRLTRGGFSKLVRTWNGFLHFTTPSLLPFDIPQSREDWIAAWQALRQCSRWKVWVRRAVLKHAEQEKIAYEIKYYHAHIRHELERSAIKISQTLTTNQPCLYLSMSALHRVICHSSATSCPFMSSPLRTCCRILLCPIGSVSRMFENLSYFTSSTPTSALSWQSMLGPNPRCSTAYISGSQHILPVFVDFQQSANIMGHSDRRQHNVLFFRCAGSSQPCLKRGSPTMLNLVGPAIFPRFDFSPLRPTLKLPCRLDGPRGPPVVTTCFSIVCAPLACRNFRLPGFSSIGLRQTSQSTHSLMITWTRPTSWSARTWRCWRISTFGTCVVVERGFKSS